MGWALSCSGWPFYYFRESKESLLTNPQAAVGPHRYGLRTGAAVGKDRLGVFRAGARSAILEAEVPVDSDPPDGGLPDADTLRRPILSAMCPENTLLRNDYLIPRRVFSYMRER